MVVGLGNPGRVYQDTRHNLGWMVIKRAAHRWGVNLSSQGPALQGTGNVHNQSVVLALPQTWMNQTGPVVASLLQALDLSNTDLILVYDDLDLPLGVFRIKTRGSAGGHNGLLSVISWVGSEEFCRLKVGIGRPPLHEDSATYVLSPFTKDEYRVVEDTLPRIVDALECLICDGPSVAMNRFHRKISPPKE